MKKEFIEHEEEIINDFLNGFRLITLKGKYGFKSDYEFYSFLDYYCEKNHCEIKQGKTNSKREIVQKKEKEYKNGILRKYLLDLLPVKEWAYKHKRIPRPVLGMNSAEKERQETEEELETRYHYTYNNTFNRTLHIDPMELNDLDKKRLMQIREILEDLRSNFSTKIEYRIWRDLEEIKQWCKEHKKAPENIIDSQKRAIKRSEENENEKETRLYCALKKIKSGIYKGHFSADDWEKIQNTLIEIECEYNPELKKALNKKIAEGILKLIETKTATPDQIKKMADYYEVDLEEVFKSLEEKDDGTR